MFNNKKGRFFYIPLSFILLALGTSLINAGNIIRGQPIVGSDYSFVFILAMIVVAVVLEFVYLFVEKMVLE